MSLELLSPAAPPRAAATYLAEVVSVQDPERLGRVQVRLLAFDGPTGQDAPVWARVAVPFAGADRGAFLLPDVGDEVLVTLVQGDPRQPVVTGGLWNGAAGPPESLPGDRVDRWTLTGKKGTRVAILEESSPTVEITTPGGARFRLTDRGGGRAEIRAGGATVTQSPSGVTVKTGATVKVEASQVEVTAGMVKVDAAVSTFSGVVTCDVLQATTVVATTYTPGAGNVW